MYKSFSIKNFRGFKDFKINGFERINLIAGMNNSGKTSLLEALFIHAGKNNPELLLNVNAFRGADTFKISLAEWSEMPWESLFYDRNTTESIELIAEWNSETRKQVISTKIPHSNKNFDKNSKYFEQSTSTIASPTPSSKILQLDEGSGKRKKKNVLRFTHDGMKLDEAPAPDFPGYFIYSRKVSSMKEDAELFGKLDISGEAENLVEALKIIEPRLKRLSTVYLNDIPVIHGDIGLDKLLPLSHMGEGISRLASFLLRISNCGNGVVFIDEIENGFHYSVLGDIWKAIFDISDKYNVQVFATTHSYECTQSAYKTFANSKNYDFAYFRLDRIEDSIIVSSYDKEALDYAFKSDVEVR